MELQFSWSYHPDTVTIPSHTAQPHPFFCVLVGCCFSSSLFPDVVNCMQTDNLELKKLVYLYLMNYAKSQPDMAIMAVNSFVKVTCSHSSSEGGPAQ